MPGKKLREESGESIAELMVAVLVVSLALLMFAGFLMSSEKLIVKSARQFDSYYSGQSALDGADSGSSLNVRLSGGGGGGLWGREQIPAEWYDNQAGVAGGERGLLIRYERKAGA